MSEQLSSVAREFFHSAGTRDNVFHYPSLTSVLETILKGLIKMFKANSGVFFIRDHNSPRFLDTQNLAFVNSSWHYTHEYLNHYYQLDPFLKTIPGASACRDTDLMNPADFQRQEFYSCFLKPQNIHRALDLYLQHDRQLLGYIGLHRSDVKSFYSRGELVKAQYLANFFTSKLIQRQLIRESSFLEHLLKKVLDIHLDATIILDSELFPIYWNSKAEEMGRCLGGNQGKWHRRDVHWPMLPSGVIEKCKQFRTSSQRHDNRTDNLNFCDENPELEFNIDRIELKHESRADSSYNCFLINLRKVHKYYQGVSFDAKANWKLTSREREIVHYVCQGLTNKEISKKLYIGLPTVATHLRHIFEKLGINRRTKLINELKPS